MKTSILLALGLLLVPFAANAQNTDPASPHLSAQSSNPAGEVGAFAEGKASPVFVPMTASERFRMYLRRTYGVASIFASATGAGIRQWENTPKEWKQGAEGYGDRVGNSYATHVIRGTLEYGASAVLREDNRYVPSRETGFWKRSKHVIAYTFIARDDAGHEHFAYSRFGSAAGAAFISRVWQPHSTDSAGDGADQFGIIIGADIGRNMLHEFWPDMKRHLSKKRKE